jgi:hypothetical protein
MKRWIAQLLPSVTITITRINKTAIVTGTPSMMVVIWTDRMEETSISVRVRRIPRLCWRRVAQL